MKRKNTVGTVSSKNPAAAALAEARGRVKVAKKRVKDAKAVLKAARDDLKAAKKVRKAAEARREAQRAKVAPRKRAAVAGKSVASTARVTPRLKAVSLRRIRSKAPVASIGIKSAAPAADTMPGAEQLPDGVLPAAVEIGQTSAHQGPEPAAAEFGGASPGSG